MYVYTNKINSTTNHAFEDSMSRNRSPSKTLFCRCWVVNWSFDQNFGETYEYIPENVNRLSRLWFPEGTITSVRVHDLTRNWERSAKGGDFVLELTPVLSFYIFKYLNNSYYFFISRKLNLQQWHFWRDIQGFPITRRRFNLHERNSNWIIGRFLKGFTWQLQHKLRFIQRYSLLRNGIPQELHLRGDALTDNKPTIGRGHDPGHLTFQCRLTLLLL